jgi:hypothetical protein
MLHRDSNPSYRYAAADFCSAALAIAPHARSRSKSGALKPQSRSASSVCSPGRAGGRWIALGVRLNRGAGAGWITPFSSTKVARWRLCGWRGASSMLSKGAKQTSLPSMMGTIRRASWSIALSDAVGWSKPDSPGRLTDATDNLRSQDRFGFWRWPARGV